MYNLVMQYARGYDSFTEFSDTFAYNFGLIYDSLITSLEKIADGNFFMSGYAVGNIFYLVFFMS